MATRPSTARVAVSWSDHMETLYLLGVAAIVAFMFWCAK